MADIQEPSAKQKTAALILAASLVAAPITASFEGLRTHPYRDPAPKHTMTVCYGETNVKMKVYAPDECQMMLEADQQKQYAPAVLKCVPGIGQRVNLLASEIDAAYNSGVGKVSDHLHGFCGSPMAIHFRAGEWVAGCNAYRGWHVAPGGKLLPGLVRRRETERTLCLKDAA
jgi:lysozyme